MEYIIGDNLLVSWVGNYNNSLVGLPSGYQDLILCNGESHGKT